MAGRRVFSRDPPHPARRASTATTYRLRRPEKEHDRGSRPRPSPGPPSGRPRCDADGGVAPVGEAPVGEALVAAGVLRRDPRWDHLPLGIGEIARVRETPLLAGAASCGRGFLRAWLLADDWRNGGIKTTTREQGRCYRAWRDPWRPMASRDFFADPFVASQDPLCLSPEDDLRPPTRERTCFRRLGDRPPRGREPASGGWANPGPLRLSPHRGEQEGSCGTGGLRFPHRSTDPRGEGERRSPTLPIPQAILQESRNTGTPKQTRADDPRPRRERSRCLSECLSNGRLDGTRLRTPRGRPRLNASVPT